MTSEPAGETVQAGPSAPPSEPATGVGIPRALTILLGFAAAVIALAGVQSAAWLVGPAFLALIIVIALNPIQLWLQRHRWPVWAATLVVLLATYGLLAVFGLILTFSVARLSAELPNYAAGAQALQASVVDTLRNLGVDPAQAGQVLSSFGLGAVRDAINLFLASLSSVLSTLVLLGILLLFLTLDASGAPARLASIAVERPQVATAMGSFAGGTRKYLVVTTVFGLIVSVIDTIGLALIGVPLAVLWGVLTFVTNYIPNIGFFLALIPPAILGLLVGGWPMLIGVVLLYTAVGFVFQTVLQPRIMGDAVGLSATVTFVALAFWAWLIGPLGALLAVPLTLLVKVFLVDIDPRAAWADDWLRSPKSIGAPTRGG